MAYLESFRVTSRDEQSFCRFIDFMFYEVVYNVKSLESAIENNLMSEVQIAARSLKEKFNALKVPYFAELFDSIERCAVEGDEDGVQIHFSVLTQELDEFYQDQQLMELTDPFYCPPY